MSFLAACCSSAPSDRRKKPGRSGSATSPSDRAAQAPTPTGRKRFRVGQPVEMLDERRAKAAYEAHEFRHPVSSKSLLELSWASQAQPRCGTRGTVTEVNTAEDFIFVRFDGAAVDRADARAAPPEEESLLSFYRPGGASAEPELAACCYRPAAGELMAPAAFRPLEWSELPEEEQAALEALGCEEATWQEGEYYPLREACLSVRWEELGEAERSAAAVVVLNVGGVGGRWLLPGAAAAWEGWVGQRIDAAGRALYRSAAWAMGEWAGLAPHQQAAARCVGMSEGCWSRGAPWLRPAELTPGLPLRLAGVATLRAACRAHPLWEARFSHVWAALRERAATPCVVVAVNVRPPTHSHPARLASGR